MRIDGALRLGWGGLIRKGDCTTHLLSCGLHLPRRVGGVAHGTAHGQQPVFEQCAGPLDVPFLVAEAEDARNVLRVVFLEPHKLESNRPRPADTDKDETGGCE